MLLDRERQQIKVVARVTSSCTRLVDAIFSSHEDHKTRAADIASGTKHRMGPQNRSRRRSKSSQQGAQCLMVCDPAQELRYDLGVSPLTTSEGSTRSLWSPMLPRQQASQQTAAVRRAALANNWRGCKKSKPFPARPPKPES